MTEIADMGSIRLIRTGNLKPATMADLRVLMACLTDVPDGARVLLDDEGLSIDWKEERATNAAS